ncbi:ELMO domain-containing protein 3 [Amphibalanus amphitrite]|uniref:ELMO domain-containing protein 3 n=1 Tax=Amphibalanus amphitrite TaxID=1232801 RepID=A0A6A4VLM6_AMPAM|nr:ELMO domain-containing protein 3 [Amphibalanus amphitrite]KAF0292414.1 ELMO domain-containing protein 3 [Amphibalanus amphitrite]
MDNSEEGFSKSMATKEEDEQLNKQQYEAAADEWDALPDVHCAPAGQQPSPGDQQHLPAATACLEFADVWEYFREKDLSAHMANIQPTMERKPGCRLLFCRLLGPPALDKRLVPERDRIFAIAQSPLENEEARQVQMLTTIYKKLTSTRLDCGRYGHHWESIGFQGSDPATDLRGAGLLSLVNAVFLVTAPQYGRLSADLYRLSHDPRQNFPLMVLAINVTRLALNALRHGVLNRECNMRLAVMDVLNEYYVCLMCEFHRIWKTQGRTIADSGNVLKVLEHHSLKRYKALRTGLCSYLSQSKPLQGSAAGGDRNA